MKYATIVDYFYKFLNIFIVFNLVTLYFRRSTDIHRHRTLIFTYLMFSYIVLNGHIYKFHNPFYIMIPISLLLLYFFPALYLLFVDEVTIFIIYLIIYLFIYLY
jgi:hypothetical protein